LILQTTVFAGSQAPAGGFFASALLKRTDAMKPKSTKEQAALRARTAAATAAKRAPLPVAIHVDTDGDGIRLLSKVEVCDRTGISFPTIWKWMRSGNFPRARALGGSTVWIAAEVEQWMASLPKRPLKGDDTATA
jgi:prophage regulatory protein